MPGLFGVGVLSDPWTRLLIHAHLRVPQIFPGLALCDKAPEYTPDAFTDIWKGEYYGTPVCVKVVRGQRLPGLREVERVWRSFDSIGGVLSSFHTRCTAV